MGDRRKAEGSRGRTGRATEVKYLVFAPVLIAVAFTVFQVFMVCLTWDDRRNRDWKLTVVASSLILAMVLWKPRAKTEEPKGR